MANNVSELSATAASNTDFAGTSILGSGLVSTADDSFRNLGSFLSKWWSDLGGVNTVTGTGDAIAVTTPTVYTALKTGMRFQFIASAANTTAVTLNFDAIGAKAVRKISGGVDVALVAGDIPGAKYRVDVVYDATANAAAGAWVLIGVASTTYLTPATAAATYLPLAGGTLTGGLTGTTETLSGLLTLNGGQVKFPATDVPSADINTIDDYKEWTFTPAWSATGCTFAYTSQLGTYTKIGNRVFFEIQLTLNTSGNTIVANALTLTGLPLTANSSFNFSCSIAWFSLATAYVFVGGEVAKGTTTIQIDATTAASTGPQTPTASAFLSPTTASRVRISGVYIV